jgi:hypothetical protein
MLDWKPWLAADYKEYPLFLLRNQRIKTKEGALLLPGALVGGMIQRNLICHMAALLLPGALVGELAPKGNTHSKVDAVIERISKGDLVILPRKT